MSNSLNYLVCNACGTQYSTTSRADLKSCRTCDDPRQYVPRTGQSFTTLAELRSHAEHKNEIIKVDDSDDKFWTIRTEPAFGINQRAFFIKTPQGNVLWDCIAYFDDETVAWIKSAGGLDAIVISHPHYYSTHIEWAKAFNCPVYLAIEDKAWLNRIDEQYQKFITTKSEALTLKDRPTNIQILKTGGHFPGSLVLLAYNRLLIADSLVTTPSGLGDWSIVPSPSETATSETSTPIPAPSTISVATETIKHEIGKRPQGLNSYSYMWSIPNMIPLTPDEIVGMWDVLKDWDFTSTHGAFKGLDVYDGSGGSERSAKGRVLDSMQIQIRRMGWTEHEFLDVVV